MNILIIILVIVAIAIFIYGSQKEGFTPRDRMHDLEDFMRDFDKAQMERVNILLTYIKAPSEETYNSVRNNNNTLAELFNKVELYGEFTEQYRAILQNKAFFLDNYIRSKFTKTEIAMNKRRFLETSRMLGAFWADVIPVLTRAEAVGIFEKQGIFELDIVDDAVANNYEKFDKDIKDYVTYTGKLVMYIHDAIIKQMKYAYDMNELRRTD